MNTEQAAGCYLVTGAAGFIASNVSEQLLAAGHTVVGVDNLNDYYDVRLKEWRLAQLQRVGRVIPNAPSHAPTQTGAAGITRPPFEFHHLDIENLPALDAIFAAHKFDAVFNLAARAGVRYSLEFPELYRRTNILGEENVLKCQVKHGVRKHVLASSSSVYAGCPMPFTEDAPLGKMQSPYAETKRTAELLAKQYHEQHGLDVSVLRYFTVFGPAGRPDMAPFRFIKWIDEGTPITLFGDGRQARDFTYVEDIARGTILAVKPVGYEVFNLGGGNNPIDLHTIIRWIETELSGGPASLPAAHAENGPPGRGPSIKARIDRKPASAADMTATWADISKAKKLLGWSPQTKPEEGFRKTVAWYLANREWIKDIAV